MPSKIKILPGQQFNNWTVLGEGKVNKHGQLTLECRCSCGRVRVVDKNSVIHGRSESCGCKYPDHWAAASQHVNNLYEYQIWGGIKQRCYNSNAIAFQRYGKRGIKMSPEWKASFQSFIDDVGWRPTKKHVLHRKDNNGDYTKENCVWITASEHWTIHKPKRPNRMEKP